MEDELLRALADARLLEPLDARWLTTTFRIYCFVEESGDVPVRSFLETSPGGSKKKGKNKKKKEQELKRNFMARYATTFQMQADGHKLRKEKMHYWEDEKLMEFKDIASKSRILAVRDGAVIVLLFGFDGKNEDAVEQVHVNRGVRLREEYVARKAKIAQSQKRGTK